jgi:hypothetical protein
MRKRTRDRVGPQGRGFPKSRHPVVLVSRLAIFQNSPSSPLSPLRALPLCSESPGSRHPTPRWVGFQGEDLATPVNDETRRLSAPALELAGWREEKKGQSLIVTQQFDLSLLSAATREEAYLCGVDRLSPATGIRAVPSTRHAASLHTLAPCWTASRTCTQKTQERTPATQACAAAPFPGRR